MPLGLAPPPLENHGIATDIKSKQYSLPLTLRGNTITLDQT